MEAGGLLRLLLRTRVRRRHLHPRRVRQLLDRLHEGEPARVGQPAYRVAMRPAAEAMVETLLVRQGEARRLLLVERAARLPLPPRPLQLHVAADELRERGPRTKLVEKGGGEAQTSPSKGRGRLTPAAPSPGRLPCSCRAGRHGVPSGAPLPGPCP